MNVRRPAECRLLERSQPMMAPRVRESSKRSTIEPMVMSAAQGPSSSAMGSVKAGVAGFMGNASFYVPYLPGFVRQFFSWDDFYRIRLRGERRGAGISWPRKYSSAASVKARSFSFSVWAGSSLCIF